MEVKMENINIFLVEIEAKLLCIFLLTFFFFHQRKNPQQGWTKLKFVYLFSFFGIAFSFAQDVIATFFQNAYLKSLCEYGFGLSLGLSAFFWCEYAFDIKKHQATMVTKIISVLAFIVLGIVAYFTSKYNVNMLIYISIFAVVTIFVINQYNKIRTDNLTKLYNRYGMDEEIREQLRQYARDKNDSFYIITCDLDNFKHINDTWGHLEGDRALILISFAFSKVAKKFDSEVFRIGGDEFVIITNTSEPGLANDITESLKDELDMLDFRDDFDIKISMGIALYDGVTNINDLLNSADKKLYEAKMTAST